MARVSFTTAEGEEKSYKLLPSRAIRIGRDPGNDIVLRDAKVSRSHAQIIFERGFFVLHDLASANGTYVNGARIRIAPLTDGAHLKLGNTLGKFTEELSAAPESTMAANVGDLPPAEAPPDEESGTADHPKSLHRPLVTLLDPVPPPPLPSMEMPFPPLAATPSAAKPLSMELESWLGDPLVLRDEQGTGVYFFRRPGAVIALLGNLLSAIVFLSGIAVFVLLLTEKLVGPALLAAALGIVFSILILALAPRKSLLLYSDGALTRRALRLRQEDNLPVPRIRYSLFDENDERIGGYQRNRMAPLLPRRWELLSSTFERIGLAAERRAAGPVLRLLTGNFLKRFRPEYEVAIAEQVVASVERIETPLRIRFATPPTDPRLVIGLAAVVGVLDR